MERSENWQQQIAGLHPEAGTDMKAFLRLWRHTGGFRDHGKASAACELCGNQGLRYHYLIAHRETGEAMWVGSQCVLNFKIDPSEVKRRQREAHKADKNALREAERQTQLIAILTGLQGIYLLASPREQRKLRWLVGRFLHRDGFTPAELNWLYQAMLAAGQTLDPAAFPLRIRTRQEKAELKQLSFSALRWLTPGLTAGQREILAGLGIPID